jgi:hypothetical protein
MNDLSPTPTRYTTERPICVAILAMGGQGGGVLSDWIVALAESRGWHVQSTSIPGVAQRTGATRLEGLTTFAVRPAGGGFACSYAARNAFRLGSMPLPPDLITASKSSRPNGKVADAARAPNMAAEITLLFAVATASMSKAMVRLAATSVASMTTSGSAIASPGFSFSATA